MTNEKTSDSPGLCLLKDRNLALAPRQGPEISFGACLWVSQRPRGPLNIKQVKFISLSSTLKSRL